ncbi:hypothetical protein FGADI_8322 [Fusarium gaditjirri]|uniref:Uncharacterized protein n=1 Tax=Fusarium gaditjirri TaxID=282569 RepID=A0A8H4T2U9_9HYPO|nr:hypothetical protein FGADI_8322 [Fusarium gaditjirri]
MGYSIENTAWPAAAVPAETGPLLDLLFSTLDDPTESAGPTLADKVFATDGQLIAAGGTASGADVKRVYTHDAKGEDLMIIGHIDMTLKNQKVVLGGFTARIVLSRNIKDELRIKSYEVWADTAPMSNALQSS